MPSAPLVENRELPHILVDNIMRWSVYNEEKGLFFNGYALGTPEGVLIVDPPTADARIFEVINHFGKPVGVLLTNRDHERMSDAFRHQYHIPVAAHPADGPLFEKTPEKQLPDDNRFPGGWTVIHLEHQKSPGEVALYHPEKRILLLGDALISKIPGTLAMLPAEKYEDPVKAVEGLRKLLELDVEIILPGDGEPVLEGGNAVIQKFFHMKEGS